MNTSLPPENPWVTRISSYLRENPNSFADAEAVARWWVDAPIGEWGRVSAALELLVSKGQLERHKGADGRERYRLSPSAGGTPLP
jgi:hypothetical protein